MVRWGSATLVAAAAAALVIVLLDVAGPANGIQTLGRAIRHLASVPTAAVANASANPLNKAEQHENNVEVAATEHPEHLHEDSGCRGVHATCDRGSYWNCCDGLVCIAPESGGQYCEIAFSAQETNSTKHRAEAVHEALNNSSAGLGGAMAAALGKTQLRGALDAATQRQSCTYWVAPGSFRRQCVNMAEAGNFGYSFDTATGLCYLLAESQPSTCWSNYKGWTKVSLTECVHLKEAGDYASSCYSTDGSGTCILTKGSWDVINVNFMQCPSLPFLASAPPASTTCNAVGFGWSWCPAQQQPTATGTCKDAGWGWWYCA